MQIETLDHRAMTEPEARAIAELLVAIWPKPGRTVESRTADMLTQGRNYAGPENQFPRSFMVRENGRIIAHSYAEPTTVLTSAGELTVLALARVCTDPIARGRKLGQAVAEAAFELVDQGVYPFALFQTGVTVRPFYEKLGAAVATNRFFNSKAVDPNANPFWDLVIMRYPNNGPWPDGDIDLLGPGW